MQIYTFLRFSARVLTEKHKIFDYFSHFDLNIDLFRRIFLIVIHYTYMLDIVKIRFKDPAILVSSVNMLLRDEEFDTLEALCYNYRTEPKDIKNYLYGHGFVYSEKQKQFRPIGYDKVTR